MDHVARYENLEQELESIMQHIGINEKIMLPHAKGQYRTNRQPYQKVYGEKEKQFISKMCRNEIELLGYQF